MGKDVSSQTKIPDNLIVINNPINNVGYRDTLERVASVLELITELDLTKGLSPRAEIGFDWVQSPC